MPAAALISFPPFYLDPANGQLWRGTEPLPLRPKPFAILQYLVEHPGQLVSKEELLKAVWPETYVSEGLLSTYIRDLRAALGDDPAAPRFIETVVRRGYRFIAPLTTAPRVTSLQFKVPRSDPQHSGLSTQDSVLVGRETELAQLHEWLENAYNGQRQVVFVTGEPGIGKTALVDVFLQHAAAEGSIWLGHGQCIEHYGAGEAYLPILEAVGRLCRAPSGERLIALLTRYAPTWLAQLPALLSSTDMEALQHKVQGTTRDRMLREFAELMEAAGAEQPLILVLEDLHWSDPSTLDLLTLVAQRREPARLLVLGTYRPAETIVRGHPLRAIKQEIQGHRQCAELALGYLNEAAVRKYLAVRFPGSELPAELARLLYHSTEGNPLFMVNMVDYLVMQGILCEVQGRWQLQAAPEAVTVGIPDSLRQLIEKQLERLPHEEQRILAVASVAGAEFSALAVAAGAEEGFEPVEARCEGLVRRGQFLRASGLETLPDGTLTARYGFVHALYQSVVYERMGVIQRTRLHRRIGERLEVTFGTRAGEIAAELAVHFEQGQEYRRAIEYLQQAAQNALQRSAHREAIQHLIKALELLKTLPDTPERVRQELGLQTTLSLALVFTKGFAAPEVEVVVRRTQELCQQVSEAPQRLAVLRGLYSVHVTRAEHQTALELAEQFLTLAQSVQHSLVPLIAHYNLGWSLLYTGEFALAREHQERVIALYNPHQHHSLAIRSTSFDYGIASQSVGALTLWHLGYPEQALRRSHAGLTLAQEMAHPFSLAVALISAAALHQHRWEGQAVQEQAEAVIALCSEEGFVFYLAQGTILRGWALAVQDQGEEGITQIRQGIAAYRATGAGVHLPYCLALLAEAHGKVEQAEEGLSVLAQALAIVDRTGERFYEAELYRLKGTLTLQAKVQSLKSKVKEESRRVGIAHQNVSIRKAVTVGGAHPTTREDEAEVCFLKAIEVARKQQAKSLELRAVASLARLWQQQGKKKKARQMLAKIYNWFTEGFDTKDLQEAKALLDELT